MGVYGSWMHSWGELGAAQKARTRKERKVTPRDILAEQITSLENGKEVVYQLGNTYLKPFITVVRNSSYPAKGKEYLVFQESKKADGTPGGDRAKFWDASKPQDIAGWVLEREGRLYTIQAAVAIGS